MIREAPNLHYIQQLSDGDKDFENQLISILQKEFPGEFSAYKKLANQEDYEAIAQIVHKLKHKVNILGLEEGSVLCSKFEKELKQGEKSLQKDFEEILGKKVLNNIKAGTAVNWDHIEK